MATCHRGYNFLAGSNAKITSQIRRQPPARRRIDQGTRTAQQLKYVIGRIMDILRADRHIAVFWPVRDVVLLIVDRMATCQHKPLQPIGKITGGCDIVVWYSTHACDLAAHE